MGPRRRTHCVRAGPGAESTARSLHHRQRQLGAAAGRLAGGDAPRAGHVGPLPGIELPTTTVLIAMERAGIHLDCYRLARLRASSRIRWRGSKLYLQLAGEEFNLSSPSLSRILFERLGLPRQRKTKTGYSTDAKTLEALRDSHPIVRHLLNHRELARNSLDLSPGATPSGRLGHWPSAHHTSTRR